MSILHPNLRPTAATASAAGSAHAASGHLTERVVAVLRIGFGLTFLWAFFDKLLALGFATGRDDAGVVDRFGDDAWINGGSPTEGFLTFGADGPLQSFYQDIAGATWADVLFMVGLLGIGLALTTGLATRLGCATGALLYVLMWSVTLPPENNPVLDDHLLSALTLVVLALLAAGDTWGLGAWAARLPVVRRFPILR